MLSLDDARQAALKAYKNALDSGAERDAALRVALAKLRASSPMATEWEVRSWLAKALAADRTAPEPHRRSPTVRVGGGEW
jgi:hypothetical protein